MPSPASQFPWRTSWVFTPTVLWVVGAFLYWDREQGDIAIISLFLLPIAAQFLCMVRLHLNNPVFKCFSVINGVGGISCCVFWLGYMNGGFGPDGAFAAVAVATGLVIFALALSSVLLGNTSQSLGWFFCRLVGRVNPEDCQPVEPTTEGATAPEPIAINDLVLMAIRVGVQKHIFTCILFFLAVFLCVGYALAFALIFIDNKSITDESFRPTAVKYIFAYHDQTALPTSEVFRFFFIKDAHSLVTVWPACLTTEALNHDIKGFDDEICDGIHNHPSGTDEVEYVKRCNARAILGILRHLEKPQREQIKRATDAVRIVLIAHADPGRQPEDEPFNARVTPQRAKDVRERLSALLERGQPGCGDSNTSSAQPTINIQWHQAGVGSQNLYFDRLSGSDDVPRGDKAQRQVEAEVTRGIVGVRVDPYVMSLLDYVYFMMYTITTTGYGDIVPWTPFAKWVVTLANIFELVFLVIFFNIVLAAKPIDYGELARKVATEMKKP